ncbi:glycoside hydrolase [Dichotomopilus funicola]|uniref:Glycoside hydrolase n=1 Tax=Dichotomopilus funicola TaxID=1934379 RepID=A0AAN6UUP6_9PEZI|nr:glycoside hydrolase [Dichotomopilus funicola]
MDLARSLTFALTSASMVAVARGEFALTTDSNCHCYQTNATQSNYFSHHRFFDFRSLQDHINVPNPIDNWDDSAGAPPTSDYFTNSQFADVWSIQNWSNSELIDLDNSTITDATLQMVNSPNNIYIERDEQQPDNTHLTLRTIRHHDFQSAAEFESVSEKYHFLSMRMEARTQGPPGAVTAMFTYRAPPNPEDTDLVQEADLEFLTRDPPHYVSFTNQPAWNSTSDIPGASHNVTFPGPGRRWSDWAEYRMDWTPGSSTWFVDGELASHITFQAPRDPSQVIFNAWSDGGSWSGRMPKGSTAYLQIRWIEMVYNNTDSHGQHSKQEKQSTCENVCSIDETSKIGTPVLVSAGYRQAVQTALLWSPVLVASLMSLVV